MTRRLFQLAAVLPCFLSLRLLRQSAHFTTNLKLSICFGDYDMRLAFLPTEFSITLLSIIYILAVSSGVSAQSAGPGLIGTSGQNCVDTALAGTRTFWCAQGNCSVDLCQYVARSSSCKLGTGKRRVLTTTLHHRQGRIIKTGFIPTSLAYVSRIGQALMWLVMLLVNVEVSYPSYLRMLRFPSGACFSETSHNDASHV